MQKYNKLVRDKIPEIIEKSGGQAKVHVADEAEYQQKLHEKLQEEVAEFLADPSEEELADVMEVLEAIAQLHQVDLAQAREFQNAKAKSKGRFSQRIILEETG